MIRDVATKNNVSVGAMRSAYYKYRDEEHPKRHGSTKLNEDQESAIVAMIQSFDICCLPLPTSLILNSIENVFGTSISPSWFTRFQGRHEKQLARRRKSPLSKIRRHEEMIKQTELWSEKIDSLLHEIYFPLHARVNTDELHIYVKNGSFEFVQVEARGR